VTVDAVFGTAVVKVNPGIPYDVVGTSAFGEVRMSVPSAQLQVRSGSRGAKRQEQRASRPAKNRVITVKMPTSSEVEDVDRVGHQTDLGELGRIGPGHERRHDLSEPQEREERRRGGPRTRRSRTSTRHTRGRRRAAARRAAIHGA
jgi:hypothetical protein